MKNTFGDISLPGVGAGSYSVQSYSYSSTSGQPPKVTNTTNYYSDPFAKPSGSGFTSNNFSVPSGFGTSFPSSNFSSGGLGGFGDQGGYSFTSTQAKPAVQTTTFGTSNAPGSYSTSTNYSTGGRFGTAPSYGTNTTNNWGTSNFGGYGSNFGTTGGTSGPSTSGTSAKPSAPVSDPYQSSWGKNGSGQQQQQQQQSSSGGDLSQQGKQMFASAFAQSSSKSPFNDLLKQLKDSKKQYKDLDFPPELRSLTGGLSDHELAAAGNPLNWRSLIWLRAEEIYGKGNFKVIAGKIEPNDINQGALGDCYFLSTLASLAEWPDRITKLFETDEPNEQGCYAVKICDTGVWQTIIMDDYLPCSAKSKQPCFTKGNENEIWVQLLEKAWAKVYGSYARIEAGLTRECLHDLTGAPTKYYLTGDPEKFDEIWEAIATGEKRNYAMTCGAGDFFEGADLMSSIGLVGSHAYSLLAAVAVRDKYGKEVRLVKLRNPWGKGEWTGDWSDESDCWTPELKNQLNLQDKDDGIFFMSFPDMMKYFSDIQICKIHDDFKYKSLKSTCDSRRACFFKITVRVPGHYYITINQESKRKHAESENYQYSEVFVVLGKKEGDGYKYIEGYQRADKEVWTDGHLDAGEYIVYAKVAWNNKKAKEFSISSYGKGEVDIEQVPKTYCGDFIEKVYISKGRESKKFDDYKHCGVANCKRAVELTDDGFGYVYYKNESNKTLEEELYFKVLEGLKFKKPIRGNSFKVQVPPGQEKIVITKVIPNASRIRQAFTEKARFI